jgi:hypothetical protein
MHDGHMIPVRIGGRNIFLTAYGVIGTYGMPEPTPPKKSLLVEDFPTDLHHRIKIQAAHGGTTLRRWVIDGLAQAVAVAEKVQARKTAKA